MRTAARKTFADAVRLPAPGGIITRVSGSARAPDTVTVRIGRSGSFAVPDTDAARLGLVEGRPWTDDARAATLALLAGAKAREYALRTAAARPLSRRQLQQRLAQRGVAFSEAREIAESLAARGVIDEAALARHVADIELSRKRSGKSLVVAKLRRRGIDDKTARAATDSAALDAGIDQMLAAETLARKKAGTLPRALEPRVAQRRIYAFLARRGFDPGTCAKATRSALGPGGSRPDHG